MSLTSKQIEELRAYAKCRKGELAKLINNAADTIEILSAKLHSSQMERSSQYYHGGWIPVAERLPEKDEYVLLTTITAKGQRNVVRGYFGGTAWVCGMNNNVIAWTPLPEPYGEDEHEK